MDEETQRMIDQLGAGLPVPQGQPTDPSSLKGLSPEALAALFLAPASSWKWSEDNQRHVPMPTVKGESGRYDIIHDKQGRVGDALLTYKPEQKAVRVDYVSAPKGLNQETTKGAPSWLSASSKGNEWAHNLGTTEIRSLLRSLGQTFPNAETVEGLRISGARTLAEQEAMKKPHPYGQIPMPVGYAGNTVKIKLPRSGDQFGAPGQKLTDLW